MGLDMYLAKKIFIGAQYPHRGIEGTFFITKTKEDGTKEEITFGLKNLSEVEYNVMYWRKQNAIHKWFVDHVQKGKDDCGEHYVSLDKLKELVYDCECALAEIKEGNSPEDIMPTESGFFFGGTAYDEWYIQGLSETVELLEDELAIENNNADYYYSSSW